MNNIEATLIDGKAYPDTHQLSNKRMYLVKYPNHTLISDTRYFFLDADAKDVLEPTDEIIKFYQGCMGNHDIGYYKRKNYFIVVPPWDVGNIFGSTDKELIDQVFDLYVEIQKASSYWHNAGYNDYSKEARKYNKKWGEIRYQNNKILEELGAIKTWNDNDVHKAILKHDGNRQIKIKTEINPQFSWIDAIVIIDEEKSIIKEKGDSEIVGTVLKHLCNIFMGDQISGTLNDTMFEVIE